MPQRLCKDCRHMQEVEQFPADKYGRPDTRNCLTCLDENTPVLLTEAEAAKRLGVTAEEFRSHGMNPAGSYTPPKGAAVPLYARADVDDHLAAV